MPPTLSAPTSVFSRISNLLEELGSEKQAAQKKADDGTELGHSGQGKQDPGGYQGASTHPSAKVESNTQAAPIGERFRENHADMQDQFAVGNVDSTSAGGGGAQDSKQISQGNQQFDATGGTDVSRKFKGDKDDKRQGDMGGTSSPVNAEEIGRKYGSMPLPALTKVAYEMINDCLADMANGLPAKQATASAQPAATVKQATDAAAQAAQAGYQLADVAGQSQNEELEKQAAVQNLIEHFITTAQADADYVGQYLHKFAQERQRALQKRADDVMPPPGPGGDAMPPGAAAGPGGPGGAGPMPTLPPPGPGADPGAMGGAGGLGGPGGDMGGGGPGGPGGDMGGGGPGGDMGGGGQEDALNELVNALIELGIPPEKLIADLQSAGGGGPGGAGGAGGGDGGSAPGGDDGMGGDKTGSVRLTREDRQAMVLMLQKAASFQRSGRMRIKEARPGTQARGDRDEIKGYIREVCGIR